MDQYFINNDNLESKIKEITCWCGTRMLTFETDRGVFSRNEIDDASLFMVRNVLKLNGNVLDLGCGYGFVGIYCATRFPDIKITLCDINRRAVELTKRNMEKNGVSGNVVCSDGFDGLQNKLFDYILFNPPIHAGRDSINSMFKDSVKSLVENGVLYTVMRKKHGAKSSLDFLNTFSNSRIINKEKDILLIASSRREGN